MKIKRDLELVTSSFSGYKTTSEISFISIAFIMHYLIRCDDVIQSVFWVFPKVFEGLSFGEKSLTDTSFKKDLVLALPYLGKFLLQIHTRINHIMENKFPSVISGFQTKCKTNISTKMSNFSVFEDRILFF